MCVCMHVCMHVPCVYVRVARARALHSAAPCSSPPPLPPRCYYTIRIGDTLQSVSERYGTPFPLCIYVTIWQVRHRVADSVSHEQLHPPQPTRRHAGYVMQHEAIWGEHVTRHTSHVTRHTSHVTRLTSSFKPHTSLALRFVAHATSRVNHNAPTHRLLAPPPPNSRAGMRIALGHPYRVLPVQPPAPSSRSVFL
jgi:hypothetical protein